MNASDSADRLKEIRSWLGLTQENLAISIGLKRENITNLESGKVKISTLHALALEYIHGVNKNWLLNGDGEMFVRKCDKKAGAKKNITVIKHQNLVPGFKDQEAGLLNNERLIDIEAVSPKTYQKVTDQIKITHETVMTMRDEIEEVQKKDLSLDGKVNEK